MLIAYLKFQNIIFLFQRGIYNWFLLHVGVNLDWCQSNIFQWAMHALLLHDEKIKVYKNIFKFVSLFKSM